jgi:hypothetical protein
MDATLPTFAIGLKQKIAVAYPEGVLGGLSTPLFLYGIEIQQFQYAIKIFN